MKGYLVDPFIRFIYKHLQIRENRNIIKLNQTSGTCLVYMGKDKWEERPDEEAISSFIMKYLDEYNTWLIEQYAKINKDTEAEKVGEIINGIEIVESLRIDKGMYMKHLYEYVSEMLEDVGRSWMPEKYA